MDISNFGVDDKGGTCLFDFGEVGLLPESFASYTMSLSNPFTVAVAGYLNQPPCPNLHSMSRIRGRLWMTADTTLGTSTDTRHGPLINVRHRSGRERPSNVML